MQGKDDLGLWFQGRALVVGRHGSRQEAERSQLGHKQEVKGASRKWCEAFNLTVLPQWYTSPNKAANTPKQHHRLGNKCSHMWVCGGHFSFKTPQAPNQKSERWKPSYGMLVFGAHICPELLNRALSNNYLLTLCPSTCHHTQQLTMAGIKPWEGVLKLEGPGGKSTGMDLQANEEHQSKALNRAHVKHDLCIFRGQRCRPRAADWRDY